MENCTPKDCAHFIEKDRFSVYRHKFIWIVVVATIFTAVLFVVICSMQNKSMSHIEAYTEDFNRDLISKLPNVELTKDSCYFINEQLVTQMEHNIKMVHSMLELQDAKIQSNFTILSIWAGVLMVVFLIFSIYSMFKTDELMRQSREGLLAVEDAKKKAEDNVQMVKEKASEQVILVTDTANNEMQKFQENERAALERIISDLEKQKLEFQDVYKKQAEDFNRLYNDYVNRLNQATETYQKVAEVMKIFMRNQPEESTSSEKKQNKRKKNKINNESK